MPLETDLSVSPYFDDYNEKKDYYKILFRPGVAVQARELNQLQTMLQKQVERFGDNIFKRGTIVDGCNFQFYSSYPYIKINDLQKDGLTASPALYKGYFVKSVNTQIGITAFIKDFQDGFESTSPDLKTLYVNYVNGGTDGNTHAFVAGEVISVFDPSYPVFGVKTNNGGIAFSNNDTVVFASALVVNVSSGTFTNTEYLYQPITGANVQIIGIDTTTLSETGQVILKIKPRTVDLANALANSAAWTIANAESIRNAGSTVTASVEGIIGAGADAVITTDSVGKIIDVAMTSLGSGYSTLPHVTVKSADNSTGIALIDLAPRNYLANLQISALGGSVGNGYAFGVSEGVIYQKGYFSRVEPQTVIVEKYSQTPNAVAVGFDTREDIIDSNIDTSLLDNALGTENENAPGANRMQLTPELVVMSSEAAAANDNFFTLAEWAEGRPYRQNQSTAYNKINDEMARRTADESGNYVLNKFLVTTRSPANTLAEGKVFTVVVDPGLAYIDGYRVQTVTNYMVDIEKGLDVATTNNQSITLDYENYIIITDVAGVFQYSTGDTIDLYTAGTYTYLSNTAAIVTGTISAPAGATKIGTARIRSMIYIDGTPGLSGVGGARYKLYLFDVSLYAGKSSSQIAQVFYNGTNKGVASVAQAVVGGTSGSSIGPVNPHKDRLLFPAGVYSLKSSANNFYTYRTIDQGLTVSNTAGTIVKDISSIANEYFPYSSNVADSDLKQLYVVPIDIDLTAYDYAAGIGAVTSGQANVTGSGTTFLKDFVVGDYVYLAPNTTSSFVSRVSNVVNNTLMTLSTNATYTNTSHTRVYRHFPITAPINLGFRAPGQIGHAANVDTNGNILTIQFKHANGQNMTFDASSSGAGVALGVNIERRNVTPVTKTATRSKFVKICIANNTTGYMDSTGISQGTVATTSSSNAVVGTATFFSADFDPGERVAVVTKISTDTVAANGSIDYKYITNYYTVGTITDNTHLTFTTTVALHSTYPNVVEQKLTKIGNLNGPWCLGVPDAFRLRAVYVGNSSVSTSSPNIVNDFYIDHNQNANYYDLSFLYKKNKATTTLDSRDWLLVQFDYGDTASSGFLNTVSYTNESDPDIVSTNDGLPLSNLTTFYNTFEIPEVYTKRGEYYDLTGTFDFRPRVENTATPGASAGAAPINPVYSVSFGDTTDPGNDLKFPVPQSVFKTKIDMYLGRTDGVFVDRSGRVFVTKGVPARDQSEAYPPETPYNAMLLNNIVVKPYPNISKSSSADFAQIVNRRIANENLANRRVKDRILQTPLTQREIEIEQPTGYSMAEIGQIDRRVKDLEYYVALSLLESDMKDRVIPSSIDSTVNRFKYGFFVDDFSTENFSDKENPSYAASVEDDDVVPEREIWTVTHVPDPVTCDYIDYLIVGQDNATVAANVVEPNCQPTTVVANNWIVRKEISTKATVKGKEELDIVNIKMASVPAPVTLYAHFYSGADLLQIYQGNTLILQSNSAVVLTTADKTKMQSNAVPSAWFKGITFKNFTLQADARGEAVRDSFKVSWTHNPANGLDYTIKVKKYTSIWRYAIEYPINSNTVSCNTGGPGGGNTGGNTPGPVVYHGTMVVVPPKLDITYFP